MKPDLASFTLRMKKNTLKNLTKIAYTARMSLNELINAICVNYLKNPSKFSFMEMHIEVLEEEIAQLKELHKK
jgi:hypothetical protein